MTTAKQVLRPSMGGQICHWMETLLCHGPGDVQGEPWELDDEFRAFVWRCYELYGRDHVWAGRRAFRRAFISRPKGRSKTELASGISCTEALGPARFDHWAKRAEVDPWGYRFRPGEPVGRALTNPEVLNVATEEGQAGLTYGGVVYMLTNGAIAEEFPGLDVGLTRVNLPGGGSIEPVTAAARSKDGSRSTFVVEDEVHLWTDPRLRDLHDTITRNITKRKIANGWLLITSTMYGAGEGSVAEDFHDDAKTGRADSGLLFDHRQAPADTDIDDDVSLRAGLTYVYGAAAPWTNIDGIISDEFRNPKKSEADNRRFWLNQPFKRAGRFVDPLALARLAAPGRTVADGARIVAGFDGSKNRDATALIGWTVEERPHRFTIGTWERPLDAPATWRVPRGEVDAAVYRVFGRYDVALLVCDPPGWFAEIEAWAVEFGEDTVVLFETNQLKRMAEACSRFDVALKEAGFTHDADPVVDRHLHNCAVKDTRWGPVVVKETDMLKIDAGVATIIGHWAISQAPAPVAHEPLVAWR